MKKFLTPRFITLCGIILLAALSRLLPHPDNFTPITALALFGGAMFSRKSFALFLPMAAMFISDIGFELLYGYGFYNGMWVTYSAFAAIVGVGLLLRNNVSAPTVAVAAISSSVWFFLVSNFGVWALSNMYAPTFSGLVHCYQMGLPFFKWTFLGDLAYSTVFFGGFALAQRAFPTLAEPARASQIS